MDRDIGSLFPLSLGIILLLIFTGALFAATIPVAVLISGTLYFAGGAAFGRSVSPSPGGAGMLLLAPFFVTSVFLVATFGSPFLTFPALGAGGVAAGAILRRRVPGRVPPFLFGALWIGFVIAMAFFVAPRLFKGPTLN
ncbi:MAG TPA: hypothetical protein VK569_03290 [Bacteroidota bacterium]|nr:hypothetical protein [Bacteroidota bacterium]